MFGGGFGASIHDDVLNANPLDDDGKKRLLEEIKSRAKGSVSTRNFPEAIKLYTKAIELNIEKPILLSNRSMCHFNVGSFNNALQDAESSIDLDPNYAKAFYRKGVSLIALNDLDNAEDALNAGLNLVPNDKDFKLQLDKVRKLKESSSKIATKTTSISSPIVSTPTNNSTSINTPKSNNDNPNVSLNKTKVDNEEEEDDDLNISDMRGYKITENGKKTTYFNKDLDENTKALIGDIAPKKIDHATITSTTSIQSNISTAAATGGSIWNSAGTWEEKVYTPWAISRLRELVSNINIPIPNSDYMINIKEVKSCEGTFIVHTV